MFEAAYFSRDHARRHPVDFARPGRRGAGARPDLQADHALGRAAAGVPQHAAGAVDPDHRPVPGHLAGLRAVDHRFPGRRRQGRRSATAGWSRCICSRPWSISSISCFAVIRRPAPAGAHRLSSNSESLPMIEIRHVNKWYGQFQVLKDCTQQRRQGRGRGGLRPFGLGQVHPDQDASTRWSRSRRATSWSTASRSTTPRPTCRSCAPEVGMVFQHFELFPHLTVTENLTSRRSRCSAASPTRPWSEACKMLDRVGLMAHKDKFPASCPVASSSAWRSPGRWRWTRSRCCSTSRPRRSIPR